jgi:hypothetical protein
MINPTHLDSPFLHDLSFSRVMAKPRIQTIFAVIPNSLAVKDQGVLEESASFKTAVKTIYFASTFTLI